MPIAVLIRIRPVDKQADVAGIDHLTGCNLHAVKEECPLLRQCGDFDGGQPVVVCIRKLEVVGGKHMHPVFRKRNRCIVPFGSIADIVHGQLADQPCVSVAGEKCDGEVAVWQCGYRGRGGGMKVWQGHDVEDRTVQAAVRIYPQALQHGRFALGCPGPGCQYVAVAHLREAQAYASDG